MIANILIALIAALHIYILVIEMFLWTTPRARRAFNLTEDLAAKTKVMAANRRCCRSPRFAGFTWRSHAVRGLS